MWRLKISAVAVFGSLVWLAVTGAGAGAAAGEPPITAVAFAADGNSVVAGSQRGLQVYDWPGLELRGTLGVSAPNLHDLAFSPAGDRLAVGGGRPAERGTVEILSWPLGQSERVLAEHEDSVMAVAWQDDSTLASASLDYGVMLWNTRTGARLHQFTGHARGVSALCFLTDQQLLVSAGIDRSLRVWNVHSRQLIRSLSMHSKAVHGLALRPGGQGLPMVASVGEDRTLRLWQPTIGRLVRFVRLESIPLGVAWLSDGSAVVASCLDGHVRFVDPDTVDLLHDIPTLDGWAYSIAVHPTDGSLLVGGADGQLRRIVAP